MSDPVAVAIVTGITAILIALIERARRASVRAALAGREAVDHASNATDAAEQAAAYAKPTGNGFAVRVTTSLDRFEQDQRLFRADIGRRFDSLTEDIRELRRADQRLYEQMQSQRHRAETSQ